MAGFWDPQPPFSYPRPFPSWQQPGSLYSIKTKLFQLGEEGRSVFSWNVSSFWVFCSWAEVPSLFVSFPPREVSCHTVNPLLVFTWVSAVTFSHLISFPVSHICVFFFFFFFFPSCSSSPFSHPSCNFGTASRLLNGEAVKLAHRTICERCPWVF